jgi:hypothetical protein
MGHVSGVHAIRACACACACCCCMLLLLHVVVVVVGVVVVVVVVVRLVRLVRLCVCKCASAWPCVCAPMDDECAHARGARRMPCAECISTNGTATPTATTSCCSTRRSAHSAPCTAQPLPRSHRAAAPTAQPLAPPPPLIRASTLRRRPSASPPLRLSATLIPSDVARHGSFLSYLDLDMAFDGASFVDTRSWTDTFGHGAQPEEHDAVRQCASSQRAAWRPRDSSLRRSHPSSRARSRPLLDAALTAVARRVWQLLAKEAANFMEVLCGGDASNGVPQVARSEVSLPTTLRMAAAQPQPTLPRLLRVLVLLRSISGRHPNSQALSRHCAPTRHLTPARSSPSATRTLF